MTDNPLIADNEPQTFSIVPGAPGDLGLRNVTGSDAFEGAGPVSGYASALQNMERGDALGALADIGGIGFDALGMMESPLKVFTAAGIGWLIEHFGIVNEILSVMAGDPAHVADHAQTWTNIGDHVKGRVRALQDSVDKLEAGSYAVDGYRVAVNDFARTVALSGEAAYRAADGTNTAATVVATTRSVIRDWFADWAAGRLLSWLGLGPLTPVTFGGAQAAFIADSVVSGARVATRAVSRLRVLVKHLDDMSAAAKSGSRSLTDAAAALRKAADGTTSPSGLLTRAAGLAGGKTPAIPGQDALIKNMENLGSAASKHVDDVNHAVGDAAAAATKRADTGKKIGSRKGEPKGHAEAAHASAKRAQKFADSRVAGHGKKLAEVHDEARGIASDLGRLNQRITDDAANAATKAKLGDLGEKAAGLAAQTFKETVVQSSNEDVRAENAQKGYLEQNAERDDGEQAPVMGPVPGEVEVDENLPPGNQPTAGPAPQPVKQETWQVRGTLDS